MPEPNENNTAPADVNKNASAPATPQAPAEPAFDAKAELETMKETLTGEIDSLKARNETLQDSLDTALEDIALSGKSPSTEEAINTPTPTANNDQNQTQNPAQTDANNTIQNPVQTDANNTTQNSASTNANNAAQTPDALDNQGTSKAEKDIENAIQEDKEFREGMLQREEMRDLKEELKDAFSRYPSADEGEVLLNIEDGYEENNPNQIAMLAEESHLRHAAEVESSETKIKEEVQEQANKEAEGSISVPQSPGSPQTPNTPAAPTAPKTGADFDGDAEWGKALAAAKAEG